MFEGRKAQILGLIDYGPERAMRDPYNPQLSWVNVHSACKKPLRKFIAYNGSSGLWCAKCAVVVFREDSESADLMKLYGIKTYDELKTFAMGLLIEQVRQSQERGQKVRLALVDEKENVLGVFKTREAVLDDRKVRVSERVRLSPEIEEFLKSFKKNFE